MVILSIVIIIYLQLFFYSKSRKKIYNQNSQNKNNIINIIVQLMNLINIQIKITLIKILIQ